MRPLKSAPGCPKAGWEWLGAVDLRDDKGLEFGDYQTCEYCHKEQIRFVHALSHPDWVSVIHVGRVCSDDLSGDPRASSTERRLRNRAQRRSNFPNLKSWKKSSKGNTWINYQNYHIVIVEFGKNQHRIRINGELGKIDFKDLRSAKLRAFDVVMNRLVKKL
jgi:hypothetical protein